MPDYQEYIQAWRERDQAEASQSLGRKQKALEIALETALETAEKMDAILFEKYGVYPSLFLPYQPLQRFFLRIKCFFFLVWS